MLYKKEVDPRSQCKSADKLLVEQRELMIIYQENLHHASEFQNQVHDKRVKPWSYTYVKRVLIKQQIYHDQV